LKKLISLACVLILSVLMASLAFHICPPELQTNLILSVLPLVVIVGVGLAMCCLVMMFNEIMNIKKTKKDKPKILEGGVN